MDLALLSEAHLLKADIRRLASTKAMGVAIVAKRNLNIKVLDIWADNYRQS